MFVYAWEAFSVVECGLQIKHRIVLSYTFDWNICILLMWYMASITDIYVQVINTHVMHAMYHIIKLIVR